MDKHLHKLTVNLLGGVPICKLLLDLLFKKLSYSFIVWRTKAIECTCTCTIALCSSETLINLSLPLNFNSAPPCIALTYACGEKSTLQTTTWITMIFTCTPQSDVHTLKTTQRVEQCGHTVISLAI